MAESGPVSLEIRYAERFLAKAKGLTVSQAQTMADALLCGLRAFGALEASETALPGEQKDEPLVELAHE